MFKEVYYRAKEICQPRTLEDLESLIFEVSWSLQTLVNRRVLSCSAGAGKAAQFGFGHACRSTRVSPQHDPR